MKYFDLSHTIEEGMVTLKAYPAPVISDYLTREESRNRYAPGTEFQIGKVTMVGNTGTYIDCPFHRFADGKDFSEIPIEKFVRLPGIVIRAPYSESREVGVSFFESQDLRVKAVLVNTGWDKFWRSETYFENHSHLTEDAARFLKESGVSLVGIDAVNIDRTEGKDRPVHTVLLREEILIVEHLCNLDKLPDSGFYFSALPPRIKGIGSFPVCAYAELP